ncbi:hypothetical protein [Photobacterium sp. OFAV2-7]|uniref:hypothetical protein n=1 Tax=Photobacterium sp. OFAV2-7 TaxID=2917748 RepID=UPI001EF4CD69|nr:hypothetical protein [Photobacterium sp. OFAV2-7]MCG7588007.1 hypothetical protein [Photobacterium sp. OFAV2-7]
MTRFLAICLLSLLPTTAIAQVGDVTGKITRITNWEGHKGSLIGFSDMSPANSFCPRNDYFILPADHDFHDQNYSLLLAAFMSNKSVTISVSQGDCLDEMPRVRHIWITQ